jgi:CubicO group peptidase (beta-lactamase class C family)
MTQARPRIGVFGGVGRLAHCTLLLFTAWSVATQADDLDAYLQRQQDVYEIPGMVVGVFRQGDLVDSRAIGLANVELRVPATTQQVFEIGSISKQFTAYGILMLVEQGQLQLDAPVGRYLTDLPRAWARPTLHQLLGHISGLPDLEESFGYDVYRETPTDAEFQRRLLRLPIQQRPGKKWSYSNTNYWLLARVIEQLSGQTYAQFMHDRLFAPLGMQQTRTALPRQILMGRAAGYRLVDGRLENREAIQSNTGRGLGDIVTTVADMALWEKEQRTPRLVKVETARLAHVPVKLDDGSTTDYGYGWFTNPEAGQAALAHSGQTAGFVADYVRFPERDLAIVVFANRYGAPIRAVGIARLIEPGISGPPLLAAGAANRERLERVREIAAGAARAQTEWRQDWFGRDFWSQIEPALLQIEANYRRRGSMQSVTAVGPDGVQDIARPAYRVVFEKITRVIVVEFDAQNRITALTGEDE